MFEKFGKTIDRFVQSLGTETTATRIESRTDAVSAPYPDVENPELHLGLTVGKVTLKPGGEKLVDGTVTYNVQEWTPHVTTEGNQVTVKQEIGFHLVGAWHEMHNDWSLGLGTSKPFAFFYTKGAGESQMALGGVPLKSTQIDVGAGKLQLSFDKSNPVQSSSVKVNLGAGSLFADGLLNTNAERCILSGGAGELNLNFTGESLQRPMAVQLNTGAGKIVISVKSGIPCRVVVRKFLGSVHAGTGFLTAKPEVYETAGYALASGPTLQVEIDTPVADITLNQVE